jgi:hypothetical protein
MALCTGVVLKALRAMHLEAGGRSVATAAMQVGACGEQWPQQPCFIAPRDRPYLAEPYRIAGVRTLRYSCING